MQSTRLCRFRGSLRFIRGLQTSSNQSGLDVKSKVQHSISNPENQGTEIPFARAKIGNFFQAQPSLGNQYLQDSTLRKYLRRILPAEVFNDVHHDLERFGHRVANEIYELHLECDRDLPRLEQYDAWGKRVDNLITCGSWKQMHDISAEEGLVAIAYERKAQQWSRLHQVAKMFLYCPSAGLYSCPLAMTDGAAKICESVDDQYKPLLNTVHSHLTSRDPKTFWTSGQWMTERRGGSDVANGTETLAVLQPNLSYKLYGYKWFSSATDSDVTFTLARVVDQHGQVVQGTKGLSLFYLHIRDDDGHLNNIQVQRLKNKLGTKQVPTAELLLDGTVAHKVSDEGRGVASIAQMLTLSRINTAIGSTSAMRRIINLARDYSTKREVFGKLIHKNPLHMQTLARMEVEARGAELLVLETGRLMGLDDCDMINEHESNLLRLLTPVVKLYTAKQGIAVVSEGLECFGGQGYMEDTGIPGILRDTQVNSIWEGTTNVLSHDVLRCMAKSRGEVIKSLQSEITKKLETATSKEELAACCEKVKQANDEIMNFANAHGDLLTVAARDFSYSIARTYIGALLLEHAAWRESSQQDVNAAMRWCQQDLTPVITQNKYGSYNQKGTDADYQLVMEGYEGTSV